MARLLAVSQQTYAKYESGRIKATVDVQARIAAILGASRQEVFPNSEEVVL